MTKKLLGRISIGMKLAVAPIIIIVLMMLVAAVASVGLYLQHGALEQLYEVRFQRFRAAAEGALMAQRTGEDAFRFLGQYYRAAAEPSARASLPDLAEQVRDSARQVATAASGGDRLGADAEELRLLGEVVQEAANLTAALDKFLTAALGDDAGRGAANSFNFVGMSLENLVDRYNDLAQHERALGEAAFVAADAMFRRVVLALAVVVVLSVLLAIAAGIVVRRHIVASIHRIHEAAQALRGGDLRRRVEVDGRDEVAQTALAFNELILSFQSAVGDVLVSSRELGVSARQLSASSTQAADASKRQAGAATAVATSVQLIDDGARASAGAAQQVKQIAEASLDGARRGSVALGRVLKEIADVKEAFTHINHSVEAFMQRTASIAQLAGDVKSLAEQTNLLALNAAIEAARAGEQGRGFAVVADEVRKLAESSSHSANAIEEVTRALAEQSDAVTQSLGDGRRSVTSSENHLEQLDQVFAETRAAIENADQGIDTIAEAMAEQCRQSGAAARGAEEIARMIDASDAMVAELSGAASQLAQLARELERDVGNFQI